jgi:hypothetical protein
MFDVKKAIEEARKELADEAYDKAKVRVKAKLREIATAEKVLANLKRELEDIYADLGNTP